MPWVRIDEDFAQHPKLMQVGPLGIALQVAALCYCNKNLTDGFIPWAAARSLLSWEFLAEAADGERRRYRIGVTSGATGQDVDAEFVIKLLVEAGIWHEADGGYVIHDYLNYQPSREQVLAQREQKREAGRKGGQASAQARAQASAQAGAQAPAQVPAQAKFKPVPVPDPVPDSNPPMRGSAFRPEDNPPMGDNTRAQSAAPDGAPACEAPEEGKPRKPGGKGGKECPPDFAAFWAVYPRKVEKQRAYRAWKARVREGHDPDSMVVAAVNYAAYCRASGTEERYIKHPATFVGPDKPFLEWLEPRASPNPSEKVPKAWAVLREYLDEQREGVDTS